MNMVSVCGKSLCWSFFFLFHSVCCVYNIFSPQSDHRHGSITDAADHGHGQGHEADGHVLTRRIVIGDSGKADIKKRNLCHTSKWYLCLQQLQCVSPNT